MSAHDPELTSSGSKSRSAAPSAGPRCAVLSVGSTGTLSSETAQLHHAAWRSSGRVAARGWAQQGAMPVVGFLGSLSPDFFASPLGKTSGKRRPRRPERDDRIPLVASRFLTGSSQGRTKKKGRIMQRLFVLSALAFTAVAGAATAVPGEDAPPPWAYGFATPV